MEEMREVIKAEDLHKSFGSLSVLRSVSFGIYEGEFTCILGPSGCGKTTIIRILAKLIPFDNGRISVHGEDLRSNDDYLRDLSVVFQEPRLLQWRTVEENVRLALELKKGVTDEKDGAIVRDTLSIVRLLDFADSYPRELSGGMNQRVALARALATEPGILLMDEPLTGLDLRTRAELQDEIMRIWNDEGVTTIFVTHDLNEALYLADRVIILSDRPTSVKDVLRVDMSRPRNMNDKRTIDLATHIKELFSQD